MDITLRLFRSGRSIILPLCVIGTSGAAHADIAWTPVTFREVSGTRPFVPVKLNGESFLFMVHGNAGFFAMTNHANASQARVGTIVSSGAFGIDAPGHVSPLGSGKATLQTLQVGDDVVRDVKLSVFEVPQDVEMQGMLGIGWLRSRRVIIDFGGGKLGIPNTAEDSAQEHVKLLSHGYVAHPLSWDETTRRYTLVARVNGVDATFILSTVSHLTIDTALATRAGVRLTPPVGTYYGPRGTKGWQYQNASQLQLTIDGQPATLPIADIHDIYAYDGDPRPSSDAELGGYLGCEFLLPNKGVIDFGANVLYLQP